jgi:hypothetical protein
MIRKNQERKKERRKGWEKGGVLLHHIQVVNKV